MHILKPYDMNIFGDHIFKKKAKLKSSLIQLYERDLSYERQGISTHTEGERENHSHRKTQEEVITYKLRTHFKPREFANVLTLDFHPPRWTERKSCALRHPVVMCFYRSHNSPILRSA